MTGTKSLFKELDETQKGVAYFGDDNALQIEGQGTVSIKTTQGNAKLIHDVQYVPKLAHNLLSVGQLMCSGYSVTFDDG